MGSFMCRGGRHGWMEMGDEEVSDECARVCGVWVVWWTGVCNWQGDYGRQGYPLRKRCSHTQTAAIDWGQFWGVRDCQDSRPQVRPSGASAQRPAPISTGISPAVPSQPGAPYRRELCPTGASAGRLRQRQTTMTTTQRIIVATDRHVLRRYRRGPPECTATPKLNAL